ncbi:30S ribosomal protein S12 methylthiotransferase RimO [bacterium]|nr:30S ribosomal protein S12 methylthiotransferase RimO [bacterium]
MKKIALITLGCAKNLVDSEVMLGHLDKKGYEFVNSPKEADVVIINTCGFIQPAKKESRDTLNHVLKLKKAHPPKKIIAVGCYVQRDRERLQKKFPDVDAWLGVNDFDKIVPLVEGKTFSHSPRCFLYDHNSPRILSTPLAWTYVKISEGCSHQCSFCSIPLIKGPYQSRTISSIVEEVQNLTSQGIKEINLISQDSTYYGRDLGLEKGISLLLRELVSIPQLKWVRLLYGYPEEIDDSLLEVMQEDKVCSYIDIPLQHSEKKILNRMNRSMDGPRALKLLEKIRKKLPDVTLRTSLVVGFPGERKKEFQNLESFVRNARFDHLGVFTYSPEERTSCFPLGDPVKETVKKRRKDRLMEAQVEISFQNNQKYLNQQIDVLIEGNLKENPEVMVGRAPFQAPEVDGVVLISPSENISERANSIQKVEIFETDIYDLYGTWV